MIIFLFLVYRYVLHVGGDADLYATTLEAGNCHLIDSKKESANTYICTALDPNLPPGYSFSYSTELIDGQPQRNVIKLLNINHTEFFKVKLMLSKQKAELFNVSDSESNDDDFTEIQDHIPRADEAGRLGHVTFEAPITSFEVTVRPEGGKVVVIVNEKTVGTPQFTMEETFYAHVLGHFNVSQVCYNLPRSDGSAFGFGFGDDDDDDDADDEDSAAEGEETKDCIIYEKVTAGGKKFGYTKLENGFGNGKKLSILAHMTSGSKGLYLDILTSKHKVAFQLKIEPRKNAITLSQKLLNKWQSHTRASNPWFKINKPFEANLYRNDGDLFLSINGTMIARYQLSEVDLSIAYIHLFNDVSVNSVCYEDGEPPLGKFDSKSMLEGDCSSKWREQKIYKMHKTERLPMDLKKNAAITIHFTSYIYKNVYGINLYRNLGDREAVLHLSFRSDTKLLVIKAGKRRNRRSFHFSTGNDYKLEIINKGKYFQIKVDGKNFKSPEASYRNAQYIDMYGNALIHGICLKKP